MRTGTGHGKCKDSEKARQSNTDARPLAFFVPEGATMTTNTTPAADTADQAAQTAQAQATAPETLLDFESDEPLSGGVCDMSAGCEACQ